ncbi:MAG: ATP-binding protein [Clostridiales bacterium]|nr:ATP-binding protein [Clostridiales bacterium]
MIIKRKIYQKMLNWKRTSNGASALLIKGARRVGKSFICEQFGKNEYKSLIIIDFANVSGEITDVFEHESTNLDFFFNKISTYYGVKLHKRESLIVFDEVQRYPKARQLIKYLVADGRYDYVETGSLISLKQHVKDIVIPSEEESIEMHPLDFEEFLWAMDDQTLVPYVRDCFEQVKPLGPALHRKIMNDFRQFLLVGGMPQAVLEYANSKDFAAVDLVKQRILVLYRNDISKFARQYESRVNAIYDNIPGQLAKKEKMYKLSSISKDARMRRYEDAFMWLSDAMIVNPCFNTTDPGIGLALSSDNSTQKIYMADTGLLISHAFRDNEYIDNELYRAILFDKLGINEGMIMENAVAQLLRSSGHRLYFYSRYDSSNRQNTMQIDFIITKDKKVSPIEVKSSGYREHSSLDKFRSKFSSKLGNAYVLYQKDVVVKDGIIHLPLYMGMFL